MGNYFSKLASSSKDKNIVMADLTKLEDIPYDDEDRKDKKERSKKTKNERREDKS